MTIISEYGMIIFATSIIITSLLYLLLFLLGYEFSPVPVNKPRTKRWPFSRK